jgi:hypothetical protein
MFKEPIPSLLIPQYCLANCWTETTNGFADNIRERPDEVKTQQQVDRDGIVDELLDKVEEIQVEITEGPDNVLPKPLS